MIETLPEALRRAISPYTGIVRSVEECLAATCDPPLFQAACEVGKGSGLLGDTLDHLSGIGGTGRSRREAACAGVGEALERYSATYVPADRLVTASAAELGEAAVDPARFALFSGRQHAGAGFPFRPFTAETRVAWVEGRELPSGRPVYVPAELVFLGRASIAGAAPIAAATSSGLACADSQELAVERALYELIERDAFMIVWANRLSLPLVEPTETDDFDRSGLRYAAVDLSAIHCVPTVLGVVRAPAEFPGALGVGAASAAGAEQARWKALAEAFAARSAGAKLELLNPGRSLGAGGHDVELFDDHILFYADHARAGAAAFLDESGERVPLGSIRPLEGESAGERIDALCRRIAAAESTAYAVTVTSPDVAELGLEVVRVLAPELCALDVSHRARFLGGPRLYEAAATAGFRPAPISEDDVNPDPHPFP
jgi:ribosomal protein S12 methylthiotransferase accessory factor